MKKLNERILTDPVFQALNPERKQFMRARLLPPSLNPFAPDLNISALLAFGEFSHIKCVPAFQMMFEDSLNGRYEGKHTIVVDSSGNTAWAVARLAHAFGFKNVKVVMSADVPASKRDIFSAMSTVDLILVSGGKSVAARAIEEGLKSGHYHLNQYAHMGNMHAHELYTGPEIARVLDGNIGVVAIAMGSSGTAAGVGRYLHKKYPRAIVLGVRPKLGEQVPGARDAKKMADVVALPWQNEVTTTIDISRKEAFEATRRLWSAVEPQPGPTAGLAFAGLLKYLRFLESQPLMLELLGGKNAAFICGDTAVLYSDVFMSELDTGQGL